MITSYYIVHDCETGGLDPMSNPITQYAAIILDYDTLKEVDRYETCVKPYNGLKIEIEALNHTMLTMAEINNGIVLPKFVKDIQQLYDKHRGRAKSKDANRLISVGHNVPFDHMFLAYALAMQGLDIWDYFQDAFIDTQVLSKMAWGVNGTEKLKLGVCCERAGISLTDAHGAMNDVEATADLLRYFVRRMRATGEITNTKKAERATGTGFFEFECGAVPKK